MIVAADNTIFTLIVHPAAKPRPDPATGKPTPHIQQKIDALLDLHSRNGDQLIIPTPALAEAFTIVPSAEKILEVLSRVSVIEAAPFDIRSAVELAEIQSSAIKAGDKKSGVTAPWQKIKFDRQIVATAKAHGVEILYTDDLDQSEFAKHAGLQVKHSWELPLPPSHAQYPLLSS